MPRTARFLSPRLHLGDTLDRPHRKMDDAAAIVDAVRRSDAVVVVSDPAVAEQALVALGAPPEEARVKVAWAQGNDASVTLDGLG